MAVSILNEALALDAPKGALAKAGFADYESFLEDLVQRRNDLAHSYGDNDILSPDLLGTYVDIVDAYLRSLVRVATEAMVHRVVEQRLLQIGTVVKVWSGRLGVQLTGGYIEVGARLLITKDAWCTSHEVLSLQSEGVERDHFEWFDVDLNVSAAVREAANSAEGASAFIIGLEWRDYWPPETRPATQEQEQEQEQ